MFLAFAFPWSLSMSVQTAQAQDVADPALVCGSDAYLANVPVPPPQGSGIKRQVQLINCSDQVLLGAANAARAKDEPAWPVFPQEGTWEMQRFNPNNPTDYSNVLTIDIPPQWYGQHVGGNTGNFWARTGCRYDEVANRAVCETGGCSSQYDCSSANVSPPNATSIVEWTFYQHFDNTPPDLFIDSPDISAVNGANLTIDVSPRGGDALDPLNPEDFHWLNWNYPLTVHGADLREPANCQTSPTNSFKIFRADIDKTINLSLPGYPLLGYVIVDGNGAPTMPPGNFSLACLSNCGKYKFPLEVAKPGCNPKTDPNCYFWDVFCAGDESINYGAKCRTGKGDNGTSCDTDADCLKCNGGVDYHVACFKKSGPSKPGTCELRGFFNGTVSACNGIMGDQPTGPASKIACTNTYGSINPLAKNPADKYDWADQPIVGKCTDVVFVGTGKTGACIGEDTLHKILHGAYTWPNDPQVYQSDAPVYRIVFSPEGRGKANITAAQALPACDNLPLNYKPAENRSSCSISINGQNAFFSIGKVRNQGGSGEKWYSTGKDWPCFPGSQRSDTVEGILCYWNPPPANYNCLAPKTDSTYVTKSTCGRIDSGMSLVSGSITPNSGDPLFAEVSIPCTMYTNGKCENPVSLPTSVSGCVPSGMGAWTLIASATPVNSEQGVIAWYKGTSNTSVACTVTVTMASSNPAEVKVYDVPKFNGTVETMSSASGIYTNGPAPTVSAGVATTRFSSDLQLGALLQVNLAPTPVTYWQNWLSNGQNLLVCLGNNTNCPRDDGPDFLPGHGPYSGNSQEGHNQVTPGMQYFHRDADVVAPDPKTMAPGSSFSWVGLAIYPELNQ
jgi:hypothetical protein